MTNTLPVPVHLDLPPQWEAVEPASLGVEAALLACRRGLEDDYVPTIAVSGGIRTDGVTLVGVADESLAKLTAEGAEDVELAGRREMGGPHSPAVVQTIGATALIEGRRFDLRQLQVLQGMVDVDDPANVVVLVYTLSCTFRQYDEIGREFQELMRTVRVGPEAS